MSSMKTKSTDNIKLAQELIDSHRFNYSVHCSYYGCLQYIKLILNNKCCVSYETQNKDRKESHIYLMNTLGNKIKSPKVLRDIRSKFESLKSKRRKADYYEEFVEDEESMVALDEAKSIIYNINSSFGIPQNL